MYRFHNKEKWVDLWTNNHHITQSSDDEERYLSIKADINDTLLVNELKSTESDLMATNGVIHVIDKLLYPA
ncbi:hypothetical protein L345_01310, partial [Ophiophagus hannah]